MTDFASNAQANKEALIHLLMKGGYIYIQYSDEEESWDYYIFDDSTEYIDGGQFSLKLEGTGVVNIYDALSMLTYDAYGIYDVSDENEVEFIDPEKRYEFTGF